jgi:hypothetical protein
MALRERELIVKFLNGAVVDSLEMWRRKRERFSAGE